MHIHNVYFWLKAELDEAALLEFKAGLKTLTKDPQAVSGYYGKPANAYRDVVENTYTYGLFLVFEDIIGHDIYQSSEVHLEFINKNLSKWEKLIVYDIETPE